MIEVLENGNAADEGFWGGYTVGLFLDRSKVGFAVDVGIIFRISPEPDGPVYSGNVSVHFSVTFVGQ